MTDMPVRGERITVRWPGGQYDFVMEYRYADPQPDGWLLVTGLVVEPEGIQHRTVRKFSVRQVAPGEFTLRPKLLH